MDKHSKLLSAYDNLNEALKNNKVNKALVIELADGLESDLGLTYKVRPFQFSDDLTEVGLLQAEALTSYAKDAIIRLNYDKSKEVYDRIKDTVISFLKMYNNRKKDYSASVSVVEKLTSYYNNQALCDYAVASDGSLLESKNENKAILSLAKWNSYAYMEILNNVENNDHLSRLLEDIHNENEDNIYSPFLNFIMNIIDKMEESRINHGNISFATVGKPVYAIDILNSIINDTFSKELETIVSNTLSNFYNAYYGQEAISNLNKASEITADKEKVLEEIDIERKILNCFEDKHGLKIFEFLIKLIYSEKITK